MELMTTTWCGHQRKVRTRIWLGLWFAKWISVPEMVKTVTNILKLSPTLFVFNIRSQYLCNHFVYGPLTGSFFKKRIDYQSQSMTQNFANVKMIEKRLAKLVWNFIKIIFILNIWIFQTWSSISWTMSFEVKTGHPK